MLARTQQQQIETWLFQGSVIVIYGARQVGKTTLARKIAQDYVNKNNLDQKAVLYLDCDLINNQELLSTQATTLLKNV